ncbi:hypothetical protein T05_15880 [Trichinella murrelli]|uniref:Uncharacterized protein n=1 Tax=Trichinella murrelli TaxID=144512 RepID=A0A0V0T4R2_9BILA|nr:hypothetical protein T05_15880 [Trichinella murrelli]
MYKNLNGLHHQHREDIRSYSCVSLSWLNGVTQYCSRNLCGFAFLIFAEYYHLHCGVAYHMLRIFDHVTKNHVDKYVITKHYHQLPLSLATFYKFKCKSTSKTRKLWGEAPGFTLRLRPRANKNLHIPAGYPPGDL